MINRVGNSVRENKRREVTREVKGGIKIIQNMDATYKPSKSLSLITYETCTSICHVVCLTIHACVLFYAVLYLPLSSVTAFKT